MAPAINPATNAYSKQCICLIAAIFPNYFLMHECLSFEKFIYDWICYKHFNLIFAISIQLSVPEFWIWEFYFHRSLLYSKQPLWNASLFSGLAIPDDPVMIFRRPRSDGLLEFSAEFRLPCDQYVDRVNWTIPNGAILLPGSSMNGYTSSNELVSLMNFKVVQLLLMLSMKHTSWGGKQWFRHTLTQIRAHIPFCRALET